MLANTIKQRLKVNRQLLPAKLAFAILFGGQSSLLSFISVYFHDIGLSGIFFLPLLFVVFLITSNKINNNPGAQIGLLTALRPFMSFFATPMINFVADKTNRHHLIFMLSILFSTTLRYFPPLLF
jgi:predicted MFS family arabinose efflux permease